jgi:hypothetical protein
MGGGGHNYRQASQVPSRATPHIERMKKFIHKYSVRSTNSCRRCILDLMYSLSCGWGVDWLRVKVWDSSLKK